MRKTTPNVSEAARAFIAQRFARSGSAQQRRGYRSVLTRFAESVNDCQVGSLTPGHVEDFFYAPGGLAETCGRTTLGRYRNEVKAFLAWCHRRGYVAVHADLMVDGVRERSTRNKRPRNRLTAAELVALMDSASNRRDRALVAFIANTGVRISEALSMRVGKVKLARSEMLVKITKTDEEDLMPITSDLEAELRSWFLEYQDKVGELKPHYYLFPAKPRNGFLPGRPERTSGQPDGWAPTRPVTNSGVIIRQLARKASIELEEGDGWHTIRRSVARIYFDAASGKGHDAALRETAALLHHANTSTTERYLGLELEKKNRDEFLKGQPFLTKLAFGPNVVQLPTAKEG